MAWPFHHATASWVGSEKVPVAPKLDVKVQSVNASWKSSFFVTGFVQREHHETLACRAETYWQAKINVQCDEASRGSTTASFRLQRCSQ